MRVAWIMSVFNGERTVVQTVRSIQAQSYTDWELVVVDDASTDSTAEVLFELAAREPRMHVLRNPQNLGLAASLNRAWSNLPADVYARVDADDTCLADRLAIQIDCLQRHPEIAVLGSAAVLVDENNRELGCLRRPETHRELVDRIFQENPFVHPTVVMRRSFLVSTRGYDDRLRRAQDYDLWLRGYRQCIFQNVSVPLVHYRLRSIPSWTSIYWGTRMLTQAVWRERRRMHDYWYPLRFLTAATLMRLRVLGHPARRTGG